MKFGQVIEDKITREILFFRNHAKNEAGKLVLDLFLFFKKALDEVRASGLQLSFNITLLFSAWHVIKTSKLYKTLEY